MQSLLQLIAGKSADPTAIEAAVREMVATEVQTALASLKDRETQGLDWVKSELLPALEAMLDRKIDRILKVRPVLSFEETKQ